MDYFFSLRSIIFFILRRVHAVKSFFILLLILIKRRLKFLIVFLFALIINRSLIIFRIYTILIFFSHQFLLSSNIILQNFFILRIMSRVSFHWYILEILIIHINNWIVNLHLFIFHWLVQPVYLRFMLILSSILQICILTSISLSKINLLNFYTSQWHLEFELSEFVEWIAINTFFVGWFPVFICDKWLLSHFPLFFIWVILLVWEGIKVEVNFILERELSFRIKLLGWCCLPMFHYFKVSSQWLRVFIVWVFNVGIKNVRNLVMVVFKILFDRIFIFLKNIIFVQIRICDLLVIFQDIFRLLALHYNFL